jgi:glycosyltransferase involved in cell wall biosynthesis
MDLEKLLTLWPFALFALFCLVVFIQLLYYLFIFIRVAFYRSKDKFRSQTHAVSVIVCARDEAHNLEQNLPAILKQDYTTTHELVVVNDNSFDDTRYFLEELSKIFKRLNPITLTQEAKHIPGKKWPLSVGIKSSKYEVMLLTDADCQPASEWWIQKMQDAYHDGIEVILGYGAYRKKPGLLNKLVRFETYHSALQYMGYALAGMPYMGVGRNLSYRKDLFYRVKGFSSINNIPGGDDDLFINKVANKHNTAVVLAHDAFTISEPPASFKEWYIQKDRHYSTARFYKPLHRFLLGLYAASSFLIYPLLAVTLIFLPQWRYYTAGAFAVRLLSMLLVHHKAMKKFNESDLFGGLIFFDIWQFFYYILFSLALFKKPKTTWK